MDKQKIKDLYTAANNVLSDVGKDGRIDTEHPSITALMMAMIDIDDGYYDQDFKFLED